MPVLLPTGEWCWSHLTIPPTLKNSWWWNKPPFSEILTANLRQYHHPDLHHQHRDHPDQHWNHVDPHHQHRDHVDQASASSVAALGLPIPTSISTRLLLSSNRNIPHIWDGTSGSFWAYLDSSKYIPQIWMNMFVPQKLHFQISMYVWQYVRSCDESSLEVRCKWKLPNGVKISEMGIVWCISITNNVESCKKKSMKMLKRLTSVF